MAMDNAADNRQERRQKLIGVVSSARGAEGSLFQSVEVRPAVDFSRLEEVFVITSMPDSERIALEHRTRE